jgi:hypothetical protein
MSRLLDLVSPQTASAVRRHASRLGLLVCVGEEHIALVGDEETVVELHCDRDGRWVIAHWDGDRAQYTAQSPAGEIAMGVAYRYTYARTLRALRSLGVPAFSSPAKALSTIREAP